MSLNDLNKEIYNPKSKIVSAHTHENSEYDPNIATAAPSPFAKEETWTNPQEGFSKKRKTTVYIISAILVLVVITGAGVYGYSWWQKNAFHQDRVEIFFEGPKEADSTQATKYIIHYKNNNHVTLKNAEIQLNYAENFQPIDNTNLKYLSPSSSKVFIGDIKPMSENSIELKGVFYAPKDAPVYLYASIHFVPSNGSSELFMKGQIGVNITGAPVTLNVTAPQKVSTGNDVQYVVDYKNIDVKMMSDVQIRINFPQGFKMTSAEPRPSEKESYWYLGNLDSGQGGKIIIDGQLSGDDGQNKNIAVSFGRVGTDGKFVVFDEYNVETQIVAPILTIKQELREKTDNIINAGEILKFVLTFQNTGDVGLRNAVITAELNGERILDFSKIIIEKGFFDEKTGIITWKASDLPSLSIIAPKATGSVQFSIPVKSYIPIDSKADKNFAASSLAKIDSPDISVLSGSKKLIGETKLKMQLAPKVIFRTEAYYADAKIKNSGPLPMQVGSQTSYTIRWIIENISNDLSGASVVSSLPSGVNWTGQIYPTEEKITYDKRTGQVIWNIGEIAAGAGAAGAGASPPREVRFQVAVTPQSNQVDKTIILVNKSTFTANDTFANQDVVRENGEKNTELYEDSTAGASDGRVAK